MQGAAQPAYAFGDVQGSLAGVPGRARSHTIKRKWETFRLHGTFAGHLAAYRHPACPEAISPAQAASLPPGTSVLAQPWHLPAPSRPASTWWEHTGPLVVVYPGGPDSREGELALPVRLPQGAGRWPYLAHYLNRPDTWHKIDLVRRQDPGKPDGWAYEAHLLILDAGYISPRTQARRQTAATLERVGGVDGNVSNLSVVSLPTSLDPADGPVLASRITLTEEDRAKLRRERRKARGRQRELDRSRRNSNRDQYQLSKRQQQRAARRRAAGLPERIVQVPKGPRVANAAGIPRCAYRKDHLSNRYRRTRAAHTRAIMSATQAKAYRARVVAAHIVTAHGTRLTVEDTDIRTWFRLWGKACAVFTPGMLIDALERECVLVLGGRLLRASTIPTAWSQHCLCGARVPKSLRDRVHRCRDCGLTGDRDKISGALGAFTVLEDPTDPSTARVDYQSARHALRVFGQGLQEALSESTADTAPHLQVEAVRQPTGTGGPLLGEVPESAACRPRMSPESPPSGLGTTPDRHARNPDCLVTLRASS